ncbi:hypothetical protein V496_08169 [Pseudogymnoascus sp. VKM F-4515 (FW-2607)]|nr:hypothetical protein V496_08169 [Pseudogymnoascus sp. VKM F-4515 (FW-2607)]
MYDVGRRKKWLVELVDNMQVPPEGAFPCVGCRRCAVPRLLHLVTFVTSSQTIKPARLSAPPHGCEAFSIRTPTSDPVRGPRPKQGTRTNTRKDQTPNTTTADRLLRLLAANGQIKRLGSACVDTFESDSQLVRSAPSINPDSLETTPGPHSLPSSTRRGIYPRPSEPLCYANVAGSACVFLLVTSKSCRQGRTCDDGACSGAFRAFLPPDPVVKQAIARNRPVFRVQLLDEIPLRLISFRLLGMLLVAFCCHSPSCTV